MILFKFCLLFFMNILHKIKSSAVFVFNVFSAFIGAFC